MKLILLILTTFLIGLTGCTGDAGDEDESRMSAEEIARADSLALVEADENLLRMASASLIGTYTAEMQLRLGAALQRSSAADAIGVCRLSAPAVADSMSRAGWSIRRVADKNRNPDNRATLAEKNILAVFTDSTQPRRFLGEWKTEDSVTTYSYYKPIFTKRNCLKCHGDMQTLATGVYRQVKKHYPTDKATGHKEGDLRGMFVVEVTWPEGRKFAEALIAGTAFDTEVTDSIAVDTSEAEAAPTTN